MKQDGSGRPGLLRTYAWLILAVTLMTVAGTAVATMMRSTHYVSVARVVVRPESIGGGAPLAPNMGTERQVAESGEVATLAAEDLKLPPDVARAGLSVSVLVDTTVLQFSYSASSARVAHDRDAAFASAYVVYRTGRFESQTAGAGSSGESPVVAIISPATSPTAPAKPDYALLLGLGLLVGAMLGAGCALVWDRVSGRLRGIDDIESRTGLPVLASVTDARAGRTARGVLASLRPGPPSEAYGFLAVRVMHLLESHKADSVLITSPARRGGKSVVAESLVSSLAAAGRCTVLVSADPRAQSLGAGGGIDGGPGLHDVLARTCSPTDAIHATETVGLHVMTAGVAASTGNSLFNVDALAELQQALWSTLPGAVVVFDAPPVLGSPETALLAASADLVLMVVDVRHDSRADAANAVSLLGDLDDALVGVVAHDPGRSPWRRSRVRAAARTESPSEVPVASGSTL